MDDVFKRSMTSTYLYGQMPFLSGRWYRPIYMDAHRFLKSGAKVQQKNEASKKIPEQVRFTRGDCSTFSNRRVDGYRIVKSQVVLRILRKEDDIFFFELLGTNEVRSLIHFTKAFEEPSELVVF